MTIIYNVFVCVALTRPGRYPIVLCLSYANLASADAAAGIVFLERLPLWAVELFVHVDGG